MKFDDEQLSRVLTLHANNELRSEGIHVSGKCCVFQAAKAQEIMVCNAEEWPYAEQFDDEYNPGWPLGKFVRWLEAVGLA